MKKNAKKKVTKKATKKTTKKLDSKFFLSIVIFCQFLVLGYIVTSNIQKNIGDSKNNISRPVEGGTKPSAGIADRKKIVPKKELSSKPDHIEIDDRKSYIAVIVDDLGISSRLANDFMEIGLDFTFALLPDQQYTSTIASISHEKGYELMLHLPMEPSDYPDKNPGVDALLLSMSDDEIKSRMDKMLDSIPFVSGVNNHMGSKFCEDREKMSVVMSIISDRGLYFVDSKTSEKSCANVVAKEFNVPNLSRGIFLDNDKEKDKILKQVDKLIKKSKKNGYAVAICHPYPETIDALLDIKQRFEDKGIVVKRLSEIIDIAGQIKAGKNRGRFSYKKN